MTQISKKRAEIRDRLRRIAGANTSSQRLTSLGMHFMPSLSDEPVLALVEINVPRLLAVLGQRVCKSKRGIASAGKGSVRVSIATADGRELVGAQLAAFSPQP